MPAQRTFLEFEFVVDIFFQVGVSLVRVCSFLKAEQLYQWARELSSHKMHVHTGGNQTETLHSAACDRKAG